MVRVVECIIHGITTQLHCSVIVLIARKLRETE